LNFNHIFNQLTKLQKIELYLIPILVIFFIFSNDLLFFSTKPTINTLQTSQNTNIKPHKIEIITYYEQLAKLSNVKICTLKFDKHNTLIAKFGGEATAILTFLQELEKSDEIISLHFHQKDFNIAVEGVFLIKTFHNKIPTITALENVKNPFLNSIATRPIVSKNLLPTIQVDKQKTTPTIKSNENREKNLPSVEEIFVEENKTEENENLIEILPKSKTTAIVGKYVFLNKQWLKIGDSYKGYIITDISNQTIQFQKNGKLAIMEMFDAH
jgi:hypothetical protein